MPTAQVNGCDLYYEVHGQGPALVFAHGVGGNHASWFQQVPYVSQWYQVVTFDHRGFGNSRDTPEGPGREAFVEDLRGLLDHLGLQEVALVGQSMGGWTCLGFTVRYPQRVRALVLADSPAGIDHPGPFNDRMAEVRKATDNLSQLERVLSRDFPQRDPARAQLYLQLNSFNSATRSNLRGRFEAVTAEHLAQLKLPVLILVGEEDVLFPPDVARLAQKLLPGSSLVTVPNTGHSVYWEQPEIFNYVILNFLREVGF